MHAHRVECDSHLLADVQFVIGAVLHTAAGSHKVDQNLLVARSIVLFFLCVSVLRRWIHGQYWLLALLTKCRNPVVVT